MEKLTQERLKQVVIYNPDTGVFRRAKNHSNGLLKDSICGTVTSGRVKYLAMRIDRVLYSCHRLAWLYFYGVFPSGVIDHINGNGVDNSIGNLRDVTNEQNIQATLKIPKHNTSGLKGICWNKENSKWIAGISINNKRKYIGSFDSKEDASSAYLDAKKQMHFQ